MFNAIIRTSLSRRPLVLAACLAVLVAGGFFATALPIDVFPDLDRPRVVILTECPGLPPEEIETLVSQPLETTLLGASGVEAVRSQSGNGLNVIYVEFGWRTGVWQARQAVTERLGTVPMPPGVRPVMTPPASIMGQIMHVGLKRRFGPNGGELASLGDTGLVAERVERGGKAELLLWRPFDRRDPNSWRELEVGAVTWSGRTATVTRDNRSYEVTFRTPAQAKMDLRTAADWLVRYRLLQISGVAEVIVMGGDKKQYQVLVDPRQMQEYGVSLADVEGAIRDNNLTRSGGILEEGQVERPVRVLARLGPQTEKVLAELRGVVVKPDETRPVPLGKVAAVAEGPAPKRGDAGIDGGLGVILTVVKQPHADTRQVTDEVEAALRDLEASLPPDVATETDLFRLKGFIDRGIYYVGEALAIGAALVVVVLLFFLLNVRTTFITLTAIPLSLAVTAVVFRLVGYLSGQELSINVMTLGGIAVALGELVDDAIVDVENIHRRLGENAASPSPRPKLLVVYRASREVRSAVVFGTAVVILAFLPLFALSGVEGRLFVPLGFAYIVSILASLLVSLTVTPVLSYYLLGRTRSGHGQRDGLLLRFLKWCAGFLIRFSMRRAGVLLLLTWVAVGLSAWQMTRLGADFLPKFDEGSVQLDMILPGGASLKSSNDSAALVDARLKAFQQSPDNPDGPVAHFSRRTGRAELDEHAEPVNRTEYILAMNPDSTVGRSEFLRDVRADLKANVPGAEFEAEQPLSHLISHMLSGVKSQIAVKVFGDDLDTLRELAERIKNRGRGRPRHDAADHRPAGARR